MLTTSGLAPLLTHGSGNTIAIPTRRLQVLAYVLAETSSAATLLDDYVRAVLNISHRLIAAWHSIALAASSPFQQRHHHHTRRRRGENSRSRNTSPSVSDKVRWNESSNYHEDKAARHVEFLRRVVVGALFQQFLHVAVEATMRDLVLEEYLGSALRDDESRFSDVSNESEKKEVDEEEEEEREERKEEMRKEKERGKLLSGGPWRQRHKRRRPSERVLQRALSTSVSSPLPGGQPDASPVTLTLRHFMRAALLLNPTACALDLMSRCLIYALNVRSVDDEFSPECTAGSSEGEKGLFYVMVASRAVGPCVHTVPCFGNRKFFFVRCDYEGEDKFDLPHYPTSSGSRRGGEEDKRVRKQEQKAKSGSKEMGEEKEKDEDGMTFGPGVEFWGGTMRTLAHALPEIRQTNSAVRTRGNGAEASLTLHAQKRHQTMHFSRLQSNNDVSQTSLLEPTTRDIHTHQQHTLPVNTFLKEDVALEGDAKESESYYPLDDAEDDDAEMGRRWFVMHAMRCSAAGAFFSYTAGTWCDTSDGGAVTRTDRLLTKGAADTSFSQDERSFNAAFQQAILIPPNAGHDTRHRVSEPEVYISPQTPQTAGETAFAEELYARVAFWCAKGQPRRLYYDPAVANCASHVTDEVHAQFSAKTTSAARTTSNLTPLETYDEMNEGVFPTPRDPTAAMPLKLLFTSIGTIQFRPVPLTPSASSPGQSQLLHALTESTEVVVCAVRESRAHRSWHDRGCHGKRHGMKLSDGTLSEDGGDPFLCGHVDGIMAMAVVHWAQGEVLPTISEAGSNYEPIKRNIKMDNGNNNNGNNNNNDKSDSGGNSNNTNNPPKSDVDVEITRRRSLTTRECHQRRSERLKMEFHLSRSRRLDVLLLDGRCGKPIVALTLRHPSLETPTPGDCLVPDTTFEVSELNVYVAPLLRHLRNEKTVMVDLDRTLVDNAVLVRDSRTALHYEACAHISYSIGPSMRTETVFLRPHVRALLRCLHVEWGIPLFLVTKSSRRRVEAILSQLLDPHGELFSPTNIITAEQLLSWQSGSTDVAEAEVQKDITMCMKSIRDVLRARWQTAVLPSLPTTCSVAVLDDAPQVWVSSDWPSTVLVAPYTLDRVDPMEYFGANGIISSNLLSALYSRRCVVCVAPNCRVGGEELRDSISSSTSASISASAELRSPLLRGVGGEGEELVRASEAVVEEDICEWSEEEECSGWAREDVEVITPL